MITLQPTRQSDLPLFFRMQQDQQARQMAAFVDRDPFDQEAFTEKWTKILADREICQRTILCQQEIAGYILCHAWFGEPEMTYWIERRLWGQGIAGAALKQFLQFYVRRPLYARCVADNIGSRKVLEKCGFQLSGKDRGFANARQAEVDELIFKLD